jgi:hypothetical protein
MSGTAISCPAKNLVSSVSKSRRHKSLWPNWSGTVSPFPSDHCSKVYVSGKNSSKAGRATCSRCSECRVSPSSAKTDPRAGPAKWDTTSFRRASCLFRKACLPKQAKLCQTASCCLFPKIVGLRIRLWRAPQSPDFIFHTISLRAEPSESDHVKGCRKFTIWLTRAGNRTLVVHCRGMPPKTPVR